MKKRPESIKIPVEVVTQYKLVRQRDQLTKTGVIKWIEWNQEDGTFKALHDKPQVGYSCIVNAQHGVSYGWLTTEITELISDKEFKTLNSHYIIE